MADFWAGYISGAASIVIGNPLDLLKVRLQASSPSTTAQTALPTARNEATSAIVEQATRKTKPTALRSARDLLAGLPAPIITYGALNALLFWSYNRTIAFFPATSTEQDQKTVYPLYAHFTAGCIAGLASFVFSAPTEVIKCRAQVATGSPGVLESGTTTVPRTSWSITKSILKHQGVPGLYHGGVITALRDSIGYGFYFLTYEGCTRYLKEHPLWGRASGFDANGLVNADGRAMDGSGGANGMSEASVVLLAGGLAGVVTWASVFPLDVVKTRVQTQPLALLNEPASRALASDAVVADTQGERSPLLPAQRTGIQEGGTPKQVQPKPLGAWQVAVEAYRAEGLYVFFRGLGVCSLRAFIVNAAQFWVYEWCMKAFKATAK